VPLQPGTRYAQGRAAQVRECAEAIGVAVALD
jgi:hypothetical protein